MKLLFFYRIVLFSALVVGSPLVASAEEGSLDKPIRKEFAESILTVFQDSVPARKKTNSKPKEDVDKPPQEVRDERIREAGGRSIKQVPKSIPKLKPQPVTERPQIRRPPMKVPKKGLGRI